MSNETELDFKKQIDTLILTQIMLALKSAPDAIDKLVEAALKKDVNQYGEKPNGYSDKVMPYLQWLVGNEIRDHARNAVKEVLVNYKDQIAASVKKAVSADNLVDSLVKMILGTASQDYKVIIKFSDEK